jgi:hypothetical protein
MSTEPPLPSPPTPAPTPKKRRWLLFGCGGLLGLLLIIVATVAITIWWIQRPIKPVVLSAKEKTVVDQKLQQVEAAEPPTSSTSGLDADRAARAWRNDRPAPTPLPARPYVAGAKEIRLTERELNGLLNQNTDLGRTVRLEFDRDAVNAYLAVPIPKDFPIMGGKMFRARGRFAVSIGNGGTPYAVLEDVTVFGVSLPKVWLGGIKGENLISDAVGQGRRGPILRGVKSLRVEPGALVLELAD